MDQQGGTAFAGVAIQQNLRASNSLSPGVPRVEDQKKNFPDQKKIKTLGSKKNYCLFHLNLVVG